MPQKTVHYFFAFASPFAYLSDTRVDDLVAHAGAELVPVPVVPPPLGPPPEGLAATVQEFKVSYVAEDAERWAHKLGLPWNPPPPDPNADLTLPSAGWYYARDKGREREYRHAVFTARFARGRNLTDPEVVAECAAEAGLDRDDFARALAEKRHFDEVPKALQLCMEKRVFGVPLFVVDGKRFWGNDRLEMLAEELAS